MQDTVSLQVLPAIAALVGVVITASVGLIGYIVKTKQDVQREVRLRHFDKKLACYETVYDVVARTFQSGSQPPELDEIREVYKQLLLVGSPIVVRAFNDLPRNSAPRLRDSGLSGESVRERQTAAARSILLAMRADLYPHQAKLDPADIGFIEGSDHAT